MPLIIIDTVKYRILLIVFQIFHIFQNEITFFVLVVNDFNFELDYCMLVINNSDLFSFYYIIC